MGSKKHCRTEVLERNKNQNEKKKKWCVDPPTCSIWLRRSKKKDSFSALFRSFDFLSLYVNTKSQFKTMEKVYAPSPSTSMVMLVRF